MMLGSSLDSAVPTALCALPDFLKNFSDAACAGIETDVCTTETFYERHGVGLEASKMGQNCILLPFAHLLQFYLTCALSTSEENLLRCQKQYKVCESYTDHHLRYQFLLRQVPIESVTRAADAITSIRQSHKKAQADGEALRLAASSMKTIKDLKNLLSMAKAIGCPNNKTAHTGTTEQAHLLKKALAESRWEDAFTDGKHFSKLF